MYTGWWPARHRRSAKFSVGGSACFYTVFVVVDRVVEGLDVLRFRSEKRDFEFG